jgi:hypothetical protein
MGAFPLRFSSGGAPIAAETGPSNNWSAEQMPAGLEQPRHADVMLVSYSSVLAAARCIGSHSTPLRKRRQ